MSVPSSIFIYPEFRVSAAPANSPQGVVSRLFIFSINTPRYHQGGRFESELDLRYANKIAWDICTESPPSKRGHATAAEIGRIASKHQSSSGKLTVSGRSSAASSEFTVPGAPKDTVDNPRDQETALRVRNKPIKLPVLKPSSDGTETQTHTRKTDAQGEGDNEISNDTANQPTAVFKKYEQDASSPLVAREVNGADNTTVNIGLAMNHVNDKENVNQLNPPNPVQVNEVEEMDTQEGKHFRTSSIIAHNLR